MIWSLKGGIYNEAANAYSIKRINKYLYQLKSKHTIKKISLSEKHKGQQIWKEPNVVPPSQRLYGWPFKFVHFSFVFIRLENINLSS